MENNPQKSRALIITVIILLIVLLLGYLMFKKTSNSTSGNNFISKIFSSLNTSNNNKKQSAQAGEDIKKGDSVSAIGKNSNGSIVVVKSNGSDIIGTATNDINNGEFGEIILSGGNLNDFVTSFSDFVNNLFNLGDITPPTGGDIPPILYECNDTKDNDSDGLIDADDPECHLDGDMSKDYLPEHYSEVIASGNGNNPPDYIYECNDTKDNDSDGLIDADDPECHLDGDMSKDYLPEHYSEAVIGGGEPGDLTSSDLTASDITPTSTTTNTLTSISSTIYNNGKTPTVKSFYVLFTITNKTQNEDIKTEDNKKNISRIKFYISRIVNKIPWIKSKTTIAEQSNEFTVMLDPLNGNANAVASVIHTFDTAGIYYIRACADKNTTTDVGIIDETNENNNCGPWTVFQVNDNLPPPDGDKPECSDGVDNDIDNLVDASDPECHLDGDIGKDYLPEHDSESSKEPGNTKYQCNDLLDNDNDGTVDESDINCHINGDINNDYVPNHDSESSSPVGPEPNKCLLIEENPLTFTDAEQAQLADLLRKFYLIAPTLKTQDDIDMIYREMDNYKSLITKISELTNQCYAESIGKDNITVGGHTENGKWLPYAGPKIRYGNPWYKGDNRGSYINFPISGSYCSGGDFEKGSGKCEDQTTKWSCENTFGTNWLNDGNVYGTGCTWNQVLNIKEYENILNIW